MCLSVDSTLCCCDDGAAEQAAVAEEEGTMSEGAQMLRRPCVRCGRTVLVRKEEYEEDPQGLITCDECWPKMQHDMADEEAQQADAAAREADRVAQEERRYHDD